MGSREDRDRLLSLAHDLAQRRLELARTHEDVFPVSTLRLMRASGDPFDRAAAWLVSSQRRPAVFLRLADSALDDEDAVVRSVVMEGVGIAALVLERPFEDPAVSSLLARGSSDPSPVVQKAADACLLLLERFAEAEERASLPPPEALRLSFLDRLLPERRAGQRPRSTPRGRARRPADGERSGPGHGEGRPDRTLSALLEELEPLAGAVAEAAVLREIHGPDVEEIVRVAREDDRIAVAVRELEALFVRRGRRSPDVWDALAKAIRDTVPGRPAPAR